MRISACQLIITLLDNEDDSFVLYAPFLLALPSALGYINCLLSRMYTLLCLAGDPPLHPSHNTIHWTFF
jgi:hypothetical protein